MENNIPKDIQDIIKQDRLMSEQVGDIVAALAKAQLEMPPAEKSKKSNRGEYSNLEDYINCCKKTLARHGVIVYQTSIFKKEIGRIIYSLLIHISGQWLLGSDIANPDPDSSLPRQHEISSAYTYAKRRLLQSQLGLGCDEEE